MYRSNPNDKYIWFMLFVGIAGMIAWGVASASSFHLVTVEGTTLSCRSMFGAIACREYP